MRRQSMQQYQGISILFFSRQSKARLVFLTSKQDKAKTSCDSKMADKTVVHERENQCKAEIKETSSAQCPVGLKGRRPHAPRGPTVPLPGPAPAVPLPPVTPADLLLISDCISQSPGSKIQKYRKYNPPSTLNSNQIPQIQQ